MKTILIVDDSHTMRRMIKSALRTLEQVRFEEASSGLEAIERLALHTTHLITLDLNMPDMHGLDVLRFVRGQQTYQNLPIIVLTTRNDAAMQAETMSSGASLCLTKPFEPNLLALHVRHLLES